MSDRQAHSKRVVVETSPSQGRVTVRPKRKPAPIVSTPGHRWADGPVRLPAATKSELTACRGNPYSGAWNFLCHVALMEMRKKPVTPSRELSAQELKQRAEANFKRRQEQAIDAPLAMQEYREAQQAVRDRTARLRAERLAREASGKG